MKGSIIFFSILVLLISITACDQQIKQENTKEKTMKVAKESFGKVDDTEVFLFTIRNDKGMIVKITNYGGIVTSILVPDKEGNMGDVVLGFDDLQSYLNGHPYFGAIVGRYGNRIAKGKFNVEGEEYSLAINNGPNHLHGGIKGFDKVIWNPIILEGNDIAGLELTYTSPDMEEGYPGNLKTSVSYILTNNNELKVIYHAVTDKATPINLTHHSYFNLGASHSNALDHVLTIAADR